jgi:hypothetical protein
MCFSVSLLPLYCVIAVLVLVVSDHKIRLSDSVIDGLHAKNMPRRNSSELQASWCGSRAKAAHLGWGRAEIAQGSIR